MGAGYQYTVIIGRVGRDAELRYTQSGVAVTDFSVAVSRSWTNKATNERLEETTWFKVSAWRGLAETCHTYVKKGMQIMVAGRVSADAYMGKDGEPKASLDITALDVQFLGSRGERDDAERAAPTESGVLPF